MIDSKKASESPCRWARSLLDPTSNRVDWTCVFVFQVTDTPRTRSQSRSISTKVARRRTSGGREREETSIEESRSVTLTRSAPFDPEEVRSLSIHFCLSFASLAENIKRTVLLRLWNNFLVAITSEFEHLAADNVHRERHIIFIGRRYPAVGQFDHAARTFLSHFVRLKNRGMMGDKDSHSYHEIQETLRLTIQDKVSRLVSFEGIGIFT